MQEMSTKTQVEWRRRQVFELSRERPKPSRDSQDSSDKRVYN